MSAERNPIPRKSQLNSPTAVLATIWAILSDFASRLLNPSGNFFKHSEEMLDLVPLVAETFSEYWLLEKIVYLQQRGMYRKGEQVQTGWTPMLRTDVGKSRIKGQTYWRFPVLWEERSRQAALEKLVAKKAIARLSWLEAVEGWTDQTGERQAPIMTREEAGPKTEIFCYRALVDNWPEIARAKEARLAEQRQRGEDEEEDAAEGSNDPGIGNRPAVLPILPDPGIGNRPAVLPILPVRKFEPGRAQTITLAPELRRELPFSDIRVNVEGAPVLLDFTLKRNTFDVNVRFEAPSQSIATPVPNGNGYSRNGTKVLGSQSTAPPSMRLIGAGEVRVPAWPKAYQAIVHQDPKSPPVAVRKDILEASVKGYANVQGPQVQLSDEFLEWAVAECIRTGPPDCGWRYMRKNVPRIVVNVAENGLKSKQASLEQLYGKEGAAKFRREVELAKRYST